VTHEARLDASDVRGVARTWIWACLALAAAIFVLGGGATNFLPLPRDLVPADTPVPVGVEPQGVCDVPPTKFRWKPGGDDVDLTQLLVYRADLKRLWQSAPVAGFEIEIPISAYTDIPAGETLYWRVREVRRGKARATSALVAYWFQIDLAGRKPGEGVHTDFLRQ
jgi:hypothetical protein